MPTNSNWTDGRGALLANLALVLVSLVLFLALCEFVVFRYIWPAPDVPENRFGEDGVIRLAPNQSGVYRKGSDVTARFRTNRQGWNSAYETYEQARRPGKTRIAVIGDSFVEALQVDFDQSLAEQAERLIGKDKAEVYRFGIAGAPLSQYLYMLEREVLPYKPDIVFVSLVHNDFDESFRYKPARYSRSFMKVKIEPDGRITEVAPSDFDRSEWIDFFRQSALVRFFLYRYQVLGIKEMIKQAVFDDDKKAYEANIDPDSLSAIDKELHQVTRHVFSRMKAIADRNRFQLVLIMDAVRESIYDDQRPPRGAARLNAIAREEAAATGLKLVDLTEHFQKDWEQNRAKFEFESDGHWNSRGHAVAAQAIARHVKNHSL